MSEPREAGYAIFCDDIRVEASGQFTYVGVYPGNIGLDSYPHTFPRFTIGIVYKQPTEAPRERVKLQVLVGDDKEVAFETELDLRDAPPTPANAANDATLNAQMNVTLSPFVVTKKTPVRVQALRGGDALRLGSITILTSEDYS